MPEHDAHHPDSTDTHLNAVERPEIDGGDDWPNRNLHSEDRGSAGHLGRATADLIHARPWLLPALVITAGSAAVTITLLITRPWR